MDSNVTHRPPSWLNNASHSLNWSALAGALLMFSVVLLVGFWIHQTEAAAERKQAMATAEQRLKDVASLLSSAMHVRLNLTSSLSAFVTTHQQFSPEEFDSFATMLKDDLTGVMSLQLAPNGIVTYLTDLERNRKALGHNLLADPKRREIANRSIQQRTYIIAGPVDLIQGGRAIIARRPIFLANSGAETDRFWGFATILIDIDKLTQDESIIALTQDYQVAIRGKDGLGARGDVFAGQASTFDAPLALADVALPNASWQIALSAKTAPQSPHFIGSGGYYLMVVLAALVSSIAAYLLLDRTRVLKQEVQKATNSLVEEVSQRKAAELKVRYMAQHDPLTGLPNRLLMDELAHQVLAAAKREKMMSAVLFIDIDGFKTVNDTLGHSAGDQLLKMIADRMLERIRESDIVARFGGDEFVILLTENSSISSSQLVAGEIVKVIAQPFKLGDDSVVIGASIGIAIYPDHGDDVEQLVKKADNAMYQAKKSGKSSYQFATADP